MPTSYLVSGANRGIGLAMVQALTELPDVVVFAGARDISDRSLVDLSERYPTKVFPVLLTSGDESNNRAAAITIKDKVGKLDVVIANAGIGRLHSKVEETPLNEFTCHFNVNVLGPLALFQATAPLLRKASIIGKFIVISSYTASIGDMSDIATGPYGTSKAAVNFLTVKIQRENPDLIVFPICPGGVATDMAVAAGKSLGINIDDYVVTPSIGVKRLPDRIESIHSPVAPSKTFWSADGGGREMNW